jgi:signal transduction histidine kinase
MAGVSAALAGAGRASRTLSRPVAELRRSALALGKGEPMPSHSHPPLEFEPVFGAFERMARDIRSSQGALEEARRRTAAVLATVATGVVALDPEGRVILANRQAVDLLGARLLPSRSWPRAAPPLSLACSAEASRCRCRCSHCAPSP